MNYEDFYQTPSALAFERTYSDDLPYCDTVWLTAHNAYANKEDGWRYAQQNMNLEHMFLNGVRSFMIDVHAYKNDLYLCHEECIYTDEILKFDAPDKLIKWLSGIRKLLNENSEDIITLHLESLAPGIEILKAIKDAALYDNLLKSKNPNDRSLTLGEIRKNNERLIIFSDYRYERNTATGYIGDLYKMGMYKGLFPTLNYKETQYSVDDYGGCEMRTDFRALPNNPDIHLVVFNHFSPVSIVKDYSYINRFDGIMQRAVLCLSNHLYPNFIAVDYFEEGECTNCISSKNAVFTLNIMMSTVKVHNYKQLPNVSQNLPIYSHIYNIGGYIFSKDLIYFTTSVAIEYCMRKIGYDAENQIINTRAHHFFKTAYWITQGNALYSSYCVHPTLFSSYCGYLILDAAYFLYKSRPKY